MCVPRGAWMSIAVKRWVLIVAYHGELLLVGCGPKTPTQRSAQQYSFKHLTQATWINL